MSIEKRLERKVFLFERITRANCSTNLGEQALRRLETTVTQRPMLARRIERGAGGALDQLEGGLRASVNEFGAELDRNRQAGLVMRPDAAADAIARFEHERGAAGARELCRRGKSRGAGAEDYGIETSSFTQL